MERGTKFSIFGTSAALAAFVAWAIGPLFIRYLSGYMDAWSQNFWRYAIACLFWMPYLLFTIKTRRIDSAVWSRAILPGCINVVMQSLWAWSFYFLQPGFGGLLVRSSLIWTALFSMMCFPSERGLLKSKRFWCGMGLCLAGVAGVIVAGEDFTATGGAAGIVIVLVAAIMWAAYTVSARRAFVNIDSRTGFSVISLYTTGGLAIAAFTLGSPCEVLEIPAKPLILMAVSAVVCISLAHTFYYASMRRIGATIPALILSLIPFTTLVLSMMIFGERLNTWQWISGTVVIIGSAIAVWAQGHIKNEYPTSNTEVRITK